MQPQPNPDQPMQPLMPEMPPRPDPQPVDPKDRPRSLNDTALELTLEWVRRSSEASELAVNDMRLAEIQARAIAHFFNVVRQEIGASFGQTQPRP